MFRKFLFACTAIVVILGCVFMGCTKNSPTSSNGGVPSIPALSSPTNGATGQATSLTLSWNSSSGATAYTVQVSSSSTFTTLFSNQADLTGTQVSVSGLASSTKYFWQVNAENANGKSAWTSAWSFTTVGNTVDPALLPPSGYTLIFAEGFENPNDDTLWASQFAAWSEGGIYPPMRFTTDTFYTGTHSLTSDSNATALQYEINPLGAPLSQTVVGVQFYLLAKATEGINFTVWIGKNSGSSGGLTPGFGLGFDSTNVLKTTYFNAYQMIPETDSLLTGIPIQPKHWYKCNVLVNLSDTTSDSAVTYYVDDKRVNQMPLPMSSGTYVPFPGIDRVLVFRGPGGPNTFEPYYVDDIVLYQK